jgi:endonuclease IV
VEHQGVSSGVFLRVSDYNPPEWIRQCEELETQDPSHVEVVLDGYSLSDRFVQNLVDATRRMKDVELLLHAPYEDISLVTPWEDYFAISFERLAWVMRLARSLDAGAMTLHAGMSSERMADDDPVLIRRLRMRLEMLSELGDTPILVETARHGSLGRLRQIGAFSTLAALSEVLPSVLFTLDLDCLIDDEVVPSAVADRVVVAHAHASGDLERLRSTSVDFRQLRFVTRE